MVAVEAPGGGLGEGASPSMIFMCEVEKLSKNLIQNKFFSNLKKDKKFKKGRKNKKSWKT